MFMLHLSSKTHREPQFQEHLPSLNPSQYSSSSLLPSIPPIPLSRVSDFDPSMVSAFCQPGFRFHPTDEELVLYYLKSKICKKKLQLDVIAETDVYKCDPEELPGLSLLKTGDRQWFFFTRKYPNGGRSNRATRHGYWKATGKDRNITCNNRSVGLKKTLVFYKGRAPTGERTDWVMHEYTVDKEDLKRYRNAQEYYALYKLFKKSGPGPKNGEQYGAPFREEEWADDECPVMNNSADREISVDHVGEVVADCNAKPFGEIPLKQVEQITSNGFANTNSEPQSTVDELDEFMKQIAECDAVLDLPQIDDIIQSLSQVVSEEETQSTVVHLYSGEVNRPQSHTTFDPSVQQGNEYASFDFNRSATSQVQLYGASEASAPDFNKREPFTPILREEDFLEMDDLLGPEPTFSNAGNSSGNLQFDEADGFDYQDAAMFFNSMESMDQGNVSNQFMNSMDDNVLNQFDYQIEPAPLQINPQLNEGSTQINNQLWVQNDWQDTYASVESINGSGPQFTSGVVHESSNQPPQGNPNQSGNEAAGVTSQFSSALWSFVESIPTTPASASESALVNLAFQRMSSFSKMRLINVPVSKDSENIRESRKRLFFVLPVVVALCAIFWVVMSSARQWGRCIS